MEDVVLALGSEKPVESIYQPVYDAGEGEVLLVDGLPQKDKPVEQDVEEKQLLQQAFTALEPSEERLIRLRFFENKTQTQIGEILHMTQVQVSRMEKKILCKMRREIL
jgi:RNA polymerase sporulation-specific sigma factor